MKLEVHRARGPWRVTIHWRVQSERGGVWLYRWAVTTPWFLFGWRSRAYDRLFDDRERARIEGKVKP